MKRKRSRACAILHVPFSSAFLSPARSRAARSVADPHLVPFCFFLCVVSPLATPCPAQNEGTMLHFTNVSDMVQGRSGPFRLQQPQVLYNELTKKYVMWTQVGSAALPWRRLCEAVVAAVADFLFVRLPSFALRGSSLAAFSSLSWRAA